MPRQTPNAGFRSFRLAALAAGVGGAYGLVLRPWHLHWGATDAERSRTWAGDELVPAPYSRAIRAVTVRAPAERVWEPAHLGMECKMMLTIKRLVEEQR